MDVLNEQQRRKTMQHIKGKDTKIEVQLRKALWAKGYRYRKNYDKLSGRPDIVLTKYKIAIFCEMCIRDRICSDKIQKLIGEYGIDEYGQALFTPNAGTDS